MVATARQAAVQLGPRNGTTWQAPWGSATIANNTTEAVVFVVPPITVNTVTGQAIQDRLPADNVIYNLSQLLLVAVANHAGAEATSTLAFNVRRAGAIVGGGAFAGWIDGAAPALTAWESTVVPFLPANTLLRPLNSTTPVSATKAVLPLQPGDVITVVSAIPTDALAYVLLDGE